MKAEHRKELQTNALADGVGRFIQNVKAGPSRSGLVVVVLIALLVLAVFGWRHFAAVRRERVSDLWRQVDEVDRQLAAAEDMPSLETALKEIDQTAGGHQDTWAGRTLRFQKARTLLRLGLERLYAERDRPKALEQVKEAADLYEQLAERSADVPALHQEALMMIAKARESLGDVEAALSKYRELAGRYPNSAQGKEAAQRVKFLDVADNRERADKFYDEMRKLADNRGKPAETPTLPPPLPPVPSPVKP